MKYLIFNKQALPQIEFKAPAAVPPVSTPFLVNIHESDLFPIETVNTPGKPAVFRRFCFCYITTTKVLVTYSAAISTSAFATKPDFIALRILNRGWSQLQAAVITS